MRLMMILGFLGALTGCVGGSVSESALCRSTLDSRKAHGMALLTPPTDRLDFETGEQVLAEIAAGCGEVDR